MGPVAGTASRSRIRCGICGERVDPWAELRYMRQGVRASSVSARGLQACSECSRLGCPACVRVVEERADDFFFDRFTCSACLKRAAFRSP